MRRRLELALAMLLGLASPAALPGCDGGGGGSAAPAPEAPVEASFEGRSLTQWITALDVSAERPAALRALWTLRSDDPRVAPAIAACLGDPSGEVRSLAGKALATLGSAGLAAAAQTLQTGTAAEREGAADALAAAGDVGIDDLLNALAAPDPVTRTAAAAALARTGPGREALQRARRSGPTQQRMAAIQALSGQEGDAVLVEALADEAVSEMARDALVARGEAARAALTAGAQELGPGPAARELLARLDRAQADAIIARFGTDGDGAVDAVVALGPAAVEALVAALQGGDAETRRRAADALTRIGFPAEDAFARLLASDSAELRELAADGLVRIASASSLGKLKEALGSDSAAIRETAKSALVRAGTAHVDVLLDALVGGVPVAQTAAAEALVALGDAGLLALRATAAKAPPALRLFVVDALDSAGDTGTPVLVELLANDDGPTVERAAAALGRRGGAAVSPLLAAVVRRGWTARDAAVAVIRGVGKDGLDPLLAAALSDDRAQRELANTLLLPLGRDAVRALTDHVKSGEPVMRARAAASLVPFASADADAARTLTALIDDEDPALRYTAVNAIGALSDPSKEQRKALALRLRDDDGRVRVAAAMALLARNAGDKRAQATVKAAWEHADPRVRVAALEATFAAGSSDERVTILQRALQTAQPVAVRAAAADLLESLPLSPALLEPVRALAEDPDAALGALGKRLYDVLTKDPWLVLAPDVRRAERLATLRERSRGSLARLDAVERALAWLAKHQSADGSWDGDGFEQQCKGNRCGGRGEGAWNPALAGMALSCFLANGHTHGSGEYAPTVRKGLEYLLRIQDAEGCLSARTTTSFQYNHAWAALALVDAYAMTGAEALRGPAQKAIDFVERSQNPYIAWRYGVRDGDNDTSVTACMVAVLHAARGTDLKCDGGALRGATAWVDMMTEPEFGRVGYQTRGGAGQRYESMMERFPYDQCEATTGMGVTIRVAAGELPERSEFVRKGADLIVKKPPRWDVDAGTIDFYYWYWGTLAIHEVGGKHWERWSDALDQQIVPNQHVEDGRDERGSWDPVDAWSIGGGRIYATAVNCLTLQTPWRIERMR